MAGRVVLITGANGGAGAAITRTFLDSGDTVVGIARRIAPSDFDNPGFSALPADLLHSQGAAQAVEAAVAKYGRIDVLVHTMGGFAGGAPVWETADALWESMLDLNFRAAVHLLRVLVPPMLQARSGRIICIGSRQGLEPGAMVAAYSASKAALLALVRSLALEVRDSGITANVILPGTIDTAANRAAMPSADRSRWVKPEAIASLALWLASDAAADVTGAAIPVYGRG